MTWISLCLPCPVSHWDRGLHHQQQLCHQGLLCVVPFLRPILLPLTFLLTLFYLLQFYDVFWISCPYFSRLSWLFYMSFMWTSELVCFLKISLRVLFGMTVTLCYLRGGTVIFPRCSPRWVVRVWLSGLCFSAFSVLNFCPHGACTFPVGSSPGERGVHPAGHLWAWPPQCSSRSLGCKESSANNANSEGTEGAMRRQEMTSC